MSLRVVSITGPAALRYGDRHLVVEREGLEVGRVPLEDAATVVLNGPDITLTHSLLAALSDAGVALVCSDEKHLPNGLLLPLAGHSLHSETLKLQIEASVPNQKRIWQTLVRAKVRAQADVLADLGKNDQKIRKLIPLVRSGDPDNVEATAAAIYFEELFGLDFVRDREQPGLNAHLNYGYAIVRSAVARAVVGAGLHPALGVFHRNRYNPFCLADDAMEPYRPMVDRLVFLMRFEGEIEDELTPPAKKRLVQVIGGKVRHGEQTLPMLVGLERLAASLRRALTDGEFLDVPLPRYID